MISANNVTLRVGKKALFEDVNIKFTEGIGEPGRGRKLFILDGAGCGIESKWSAPSA